MAQSTFEEHDIHTLYTWYEIRSFYFQRSYVGTKGTFEIKYAIV